MDLNNINQENNDNDDFNIVDNSNNNTFSHLSSILNNIEYSKGSSILNVEIEFKKNYSIIEFRGVIGNHLKTLTKKEEENNNKINNTADFITEINDIFISGGTHNLLNLYNSFYEIIKEIRTYDWICNVFFSLKKK